VSCGFVKFRPKKKLTETEELFVRALSTVCNGLGRNLQLLLLREVLEAGANCVTGLGRMALAREWARRQGRTFLEAPHEK
jgi:hypothetical protein